MATLQYVGARYVPKLFNDGQGGMEWQANTYYEPLTIVTYNNSSYTSRGPVSANVGNPAENGEHWAETGNYNGFIDSVNKKIDETQEYIENYNEQNAWLRNRNFLILGDSYGEYRDGVVGWVYVLRDIFNIWGVKSTPVAYGGAAWANTTYKTWLQLLQEQGDLSQYTDIIIGGGANDRAQSQQAIASAMSSVRTYLKPYNVHLYYAHFGNTSVSANRMEFNECAVNAEFSARYSQISWVSGAMSWMHNTTFFSSDGVHPSNAGTSSIANNYFQYIVNGATRITRYSNRGAVKVLTRGDRLSIGIDTSQISISSLSSGSRVDSGLAVPSDIIVSKETMFSTYGYLISESNVIPAEIYFTFTADRKILIGARFTGTASAITQIGIDQSWFDTDIMFL